MIAQQQIQYQQYHQQQFMMQARTSLPTHMLPLSPRLLPLGSPGPVTPLTLEDSAGGYLYANENTLQLQPRDIEKLYAIERERALVEAAERR